MEQDQLALATEQLRQDFITQATQLGYNESELQMYAAAFGDVSVAIGNVPRDITVEANADPALQALNEFVAQANSALGGVNRTVKIGADTSAAQDSLSRFGRNLAGLIDLNYRYSRITNSLNSIGVLSAAGRAAAQAEAISIKNALNNGTWATGGYTGAGGFELYVWNKDARKLWDAVFEAGKELDILPCGLGCRDTLRLEKGFCLYGNDINDTTSPIEAGLGWITKFTKDFVNSSYHKSLKENGVSKKLVGFEMIDRGIPRQHYNIKDAAGNIIGEVTSGTQSPTLGKAIGMGYVATEFSKAGSEIFIDIRDKALKAIVSKIPFL
jgi:hypothetical protein